VQQRDGRYSNVFATFTDALRRAEQAGVRGDTASLDVFETVSQGEVPFPPTVFDRPDQHALGKISGARYGRLVPLVEPGL
jgi:hypothetical protein